jgi:hypothetical protein
LTRVGNSSKNAGAMTAFSELELDHAKALATALDKTGVPNAQVVEQLAAALERPSTAVGASLGDVDRAQANALALEIASGLVVENGAQSMPDALLLSIGRRIHESDDKQGYAAALIATAARLRQQPGAQPATTQVISLAAIALGDYALNGALCRALYAPG